MLHGNTFLRKISRTRQAGIHDPLPLLGGAVLEPELQLFPEGIDHYVDIVVVLRRAAHTECKTAGVIREVGCRPRSVPGDIFPPEPAATERRMAFTKRNHALEETEDVLICPKLAPVQPSGWVVLVVRIIVAELCVQEFIPGPEHGSPVRQHEQAEEILDL